MTSRWDYWRFLWRSHSDSATHELEEIKAESIGQTVSQAYRVRSKKTGERGVVIEFEGGHRIMLSHLPSFDAEPFSVREVYDYGSTGQVISDVMWNIGESFVMVDFCGRHAPIMRVILYSVDNVT